MNNQDFELIVDPIAMELSQLFYQWEPSDLDMWAKYCEGADA